MITNSLTGYKIPIKIRKDGKFMLGGGYVVVSIKAELAAKNYKYIDASKAVGIPAQTFYRKLKANRFTLEEADKIMALLGKKLVVEDIQQKS